MEVNLRAWSNLWIWFSGSLGLSFKILIRVMSVTISWRLKLPFLSASIKQSKYKCDPNHLCIKKNEGRRIDFISISLDKIFTVSENRWNESSTQYMYKLSSGSFIHNFTNHTSWICHGPRDNEVSNLSYSIRENHRHL